MMNGDALPPAVLQRKAVVHVRQSTQAQVEHNTESRRRQDELVEVARRRGFRTVEVIDDDLGRSASGMVARPGFEKLVAALCAGEIGAVLCLDASRLARNGRDWHHLLDPCGLVEARVIDLDGVHDPCRPNDRLLLGMKGSISEFELGVIRARMVDAARARARRGELRISVPIGHVWYRDMGLGFDPDIRLQKVIRLVFERFRQLGSARQAHLSLTAEGGVLCASVGWEAPDVLRPAADPPSQRHRPPEDPFLRRGLCLRQKREAGRAGRRAGAQVLRSQQAARSLGRADPRSS
jgi:DNA invertase Pin-like site-specific DNA recombinase